MAGRHRPAVRAPWVPLLALATVLTACEDQGNAGDDNLLTGASLVVVIIIVVVIVYFVRRRR